jgi:hypothetical protein
MPRVSRTARSETETETVTVTAGSGPGTGGRLSSTDNDMGDHKSSRATVTDHVSVNRHTRRHYVRQRLLHRRNAMKLKRRQQVERHTGPDADESGSGFMSSNAMIEHSTSKQELKFDLNDIPDQQDCMKLLQPQRAVSVSETRHIHCQSVLKQLETQISHDVDHATHSHSHNQSALSVSVLETQQYQTHYDISSKFRYNEPVGSDVDVMTVADSEHKHRNQFASSHQSIGVSMLRFPPRPSGRATAVVNLTVKSTESVSQSANNIETCNSTTTWFRKSPQWFQPRYCSMPLVTDNVEPGIIGSFQRRHNNHCTGPALHAIGSSNLLTRSGCYDTHSAFHWLYETGKLRCFKHETEATATPVETTTISSMLSNRGFQAEQVLSSVQSYGITQNLVCSRLETQFVATDVMRIETDQEFQDYETIINSTWCIEHQMILHSPVRELLLSRPFIDIPPSKIVSKFAPLLSAFDIMADLKLYLTDESDARSPTGCEIETHQFQQSQSQSQSSSLCPSSAVYEQLCFLELDDTDTDTDADADTDTVCDTDEVSIMTIVMIEPVFSALNQNTASLANSATDSHNMAKVFTDLQQLQTTCPVQLDTQPDAVSEFDSDSELLHALCAKHREQVNTDLQTALCSTVTKVTVAPPVPLLHVPFVMSVPEPENLELLQHSASHEEAFNRVSLDLELSLMTLQLPELFTSRNVSYIVPMSIHTLQDSQSVDSQSTWTNLFRFGIHTMTLSHSQSTHCQSESAPQADTLRSLLQSKYTGSDHDQQSGYIQSVHSQFVCETHRILAVSPFVHPDTPVLIDPPALEHPHAYFHHRIHSAGPSASATDDNTDDGWKMSTMVYFQSILAASSRFGSSSFVDWLSQRNGIPAPHVMPSPTATKSSIRAHIHESMRHAQPHTMLSTRKGWMDTTTAAAAVSHSTDSQSVQAYGAGMRSELSHDIVADEAGTVKLTTSKASQQDYDSMWLGSSTLTVSLSHCQSVGSESQHTTVAKSTTEPTQTLETKQSSVLHQTTERLRHFRRLETLLSSDPSSAPATADLLNPLSGHEQQQQLYSAFRVSLESVSADEDGYFGSNSDPLLGVQSLQVCLRLAKSSHSINNMVTCPSGVSDTVDLTMDSATHDAKADTSASHRKAKRSHAQFNSLDAYIRLASGDQDFQEDDKPCTAVSTLFASPECKNQILTPQSAAAPSSTVAAAAAADHSTSSSSPSVEQKQKQLLTVHTVEIEMTAVSQTIADLIHMLDRIVHPLLVSRNGTNMSTSSLVPQLISQPSDSESHSPVILSLDLQRISKLIAKLERRSAAGRSRTLSHNATSRSHSKAAATKAQQDMLHVSATTNGLHICVALILLVRELMQHGITASYFAWRHMLREHVQLSRSSITHSRHWVQDIDTIQSVLSCLYESVHQGEIHDHSQLLPALASTMVEVTNTWHHHTAFSNISSNILIVVPRLCMAAPVHAHLRAVAAKLQLSLPSSATLQINVLDSMTGLIALQRTAHQRRNRITIVAAATILNDTLADAEDQMPWTDFSDAICWGHHAATVTHKSVSAFHTSYRHSHRHSHGHGREDATATRHNIHMLALPASSTIIEAKYWNSLLTASIGPAPSTTTTAAAASTDDSESQSDTDMKHPDDNDQASMLVLDEEAAHHQHDTIALMQQHCSSQQSVMLRPLASTIHIPGLWCLTTQYTAIVVIPNQDIARKPIEQLINFLAKAHQHITECVIIAPVLQGGSPGTGTGTAGSPVSSCCTPSVEQTLLRLVASTSAGFPVPVRTLLIHPELVAQVTAHVSLTSCSAIPNSHDKALLEMVNADTSSVAGGGAAATSATVQESGLCTLPFVNPLAAAEIMYRFQSLRAFCDSDEAAALSIITHNQDLVNEAMMNQSKTRSSMSGPRRQRQRQQQDESSKISAVPVPEPEPAPGPGAGAGASTVHLFACMQKLQEVFHMTVLHATQPQPQPQPN